MMKKTLAICLGLALILTLCGTFAGALASEVENGIDAIEDAMMKGNTNTSSFFDGMDDLREGTSADTVPTPDDFPSKYNYGSGKIQDYSRDNMLRRLSEPEGNATVLNTAADPEHIQALFLWEEDNVPTKTRFTENMTGYFDSWNFRPYVTAIPVRTGVQPKGAVVLMAGGAYQFRGNYTDSLPTAAALRELGFQTFIVDYRLSPYTQEEGALDVARAVRFIRKNASVYGINPDAIAVMGFSAGGIQAGEFLMHYDEDVTGAALDSRYVPDELDSIPAHASAAGMIYSFYGRLSVGNMDASWLAEGNLPPTFYVYGTEDPFYRQFQQQYDVIRGMGIPTGRIVLNGWPHGFGSDGGWVTDYAAWLENVFANLSSKESFVIDRAGGFSYHTETMELDTENGRLHTVLYIPESGASVYPAVIFSHGYGDTNHGGQAYAQALASQGYLAVCFDFRGGGPGSQSDGSPLETTIFTEQQDLEAEIAMLRARSDVDEQYIFLLGNSQGGVVSALTAAAHPDWVCAMTLSSPAFSLADDARKFFGSADEIPEQYFHLLMNVGRNYFASVYDFDPIDAAKSYPGDVLIFHGNRDTLVPIDYSRRAAESFPNAMLQVLSGEGHMYSGQAVRQTIDSISDFFYTHLGKAAMPQS